jgi:chemotaxis-related protein WspB
MLMLIFYVGSDCYCCSCETMLEIIPKIPLKPIPQAPSYLAGLLNYGGESVPIIDFSMIIAQRPSDNYMHSRIILFKTEQEGQTKILGLIAEKIIETRNIDPKLFNEPGIHIQKLSFLNGIYNTEHESIQWVNLKRFFETLEILQL